MIVLLIKALFMFLWYATFHALKISKLSQLPIRMKFGGRIKIPVCLHSNKYSARISEKNGNIFVSAGRQTINLSRLSTYLYYRTHVPSCIQTKIILLVGSPPRLSLFDFRLYLLYSSLLDRLPQPDRLHLAPNRRFRISKNCWSNTPDIIGLNRLIGNCT